MCNIENLNTNLDKNFEEAYVLCDKNFSHDELLEMLKNGNIVQKQIAALKFDYVKDLKDSKALLSNLTGCDGKIREAVAYTINRLLQQEDEVKKIFAGISGEIFADASIDINGNICRLVIDSANLLKNYEQFRSVYLKRITDYAKQALDELDKFIFRDKKYVINKQLFKLYWCLETIINYSEYIDTEILKNILQRSLEQQEYTIRERVALIVKNDNRFPELKKELVQDENYYVRIALT